MEDYSGIIEAMKIEFAKYGSDEIKFELINDKEERIREIIAEYGSNVLRWELVNDKSKWVRETVARYGTDGMRWKLIDDEDAWVRKTVAEYGTKEMCIKLCNDDDVWVRDEVKNRLLQIERSGKQTELITDEYLKKNEAINNEARFTTIFVISLILIVILIIVGIKIFL